MATARAAFSRLTVVVAVCAAATVLGGCTSTKAGTSFGPAQPLGQGAAKTYTVTDEAGNPTEVGLRISAAALDGLPAEDTMPPTMTILAFPPQARSTVFDHVMLNWNSHGHDPAVLFGKPHFDFHFYMTDPAAVMAIDPNTPDFPTKAAHVPDARYIPVDYVKPPGPPAENTVPAMGLHWTDAKDNMIPGQYDFKEALINGSWDGRYTFIEPMLTRAWLLTRTDTKRELKQPTAYQKDGYFPTTYAVHYDETAKEYVIALGGLTMHKAS